MRVQNLPRSSGAVCGPVVERGAGGLGRLVDVVGGALGDRPDDRAVGRVVHVDRAGALGRHPCAVDVDLVVGLHLRSPLLVGSAGGSLNLTQRSRTSTLPHLGTGISGEAGGGGELSAGVPGTVGGDRREPGGEGRAIASLTPQRDARGHEQDHGGEAPDPHAERGVHRWPLGSKDLRSGL